jgi:peptidoglycan hydrolase-like protein with peptidoglycan-binding domain
MKNTCFAIFSVLLVAPLARGDELTRSVQTELKNQGFYYSEITGVNGPDTVAAVKRYQIRNGLEVTGSLSKETLQSLGMEGGAPALEVPKPAPLPAPKPLPPPPGRNLPPKSEPPVNLRREESDQESDRSFLKKQRPPAPAPHEDQDMRPPSGPSGGGEYGQLYSRTPYATAPLEVQQSTLKKAQRFLAEQGFFRGTSDGTPGPDTEEAILGYQRLIRLPLTGRLDLETLSAMRLLPGRGPGAPAMRPFNPQQQPRPSGKVYRGIWVD